MIKHTHLLTFALALVFQTSSFAADAAAPSAAQLAKGQAAYATCMACHGPDGKGLPTTPPMAPSLVGSKLALAPAELPTTIVLKGIAKQDAKFLGIMAPLGAALNDEQIADVLTYVRNSWGNKGSIVTPEEVKATREKYKDLNVSLSRATLEKKAAMLSEGAKAPEGGAPAPATPAAPAEAPATPPAAK